MRLKVVNGTKSKKLCGYMSRGSKDNLVAMAPEKETFKPDVEDKEDGSFHIRFEWLGALSNVASKVPFANPSGTPASLAISSNSTTRAVLFQSPPQSFTLASVIITNFNPSFDLPPPVAA